MPWPHAQPRCECKEPGKVRGYRGVCRAVFGVDATRAEEERVFMIRRFPILFVQPSVFSER